MQPTAPQQMTQFQTPQDERPRSPQPREGSFDTQIPRRPTTEGTSTSLGVPAARSISHSQDIVHTVPEPDVISSDSTDFVKEQIRQVNQRLDDVQREFVKSKEELGESSKGGSSFVPEIQGKPIPTNFRLPMLKVIGRQASGSYRRRTDKSELPPPRPPTSLNLTQECHDLKNEIEDLIQQGHLSWYIRDQQTPTNKNRRRVGRSSPRPKGPIEKQINVIICGPTS
ncbi:hypothetical protein GW17_00035232 [Ensete ventricosum]|nr:hypothetical protein GW17_00035232 [Ensete ventricosum]